MTRRDDERVSNTITTALVLVCLMSMCAFLLFLLLAWFAPSADASEPETPRWSASEVQVYVPVSLKGRGWKVGRAIRAWDASPSVNVRRTTVPCTGCITITETPWYAIEGIDIKWAGVAFPQIDPTSNAIVGCQINLNRDRRGPGLPAHEIGHCLGLSHNSQQRSVMSNVWSWSTVSAKDYAALAGLYA